MASSKRHMERKLNNQRHEAVIETRQTFGNWLADKRVRAGLTQKGLADALGFSTSQFISNFERGLSMPPIPSVPALAKALGLSSWTVLSHLQSCQLKQLEVEQRFARTRLLTIEIPEARQ